MTKALKSEAARMAQIGWQQAAEACWHFSRACELLAQAAEGEVEDAAAPEAGEQPPPPARPTTGQEAIADTDRARARRALRRAGVAPKGDGAR